MKIKSFDLALLFGRKAPDSTLLKAALAELLRNSLVQASSKLQAGSTAAACAVPLKEALAYSSGIPAHSSTEGFLASYPLQRQVILVPNRNGMQFSTE